MNDFTSKPQRRNTRPGSPSFLDDPRTARDGERIGSGFIVFRRGKGSGRLRCPEYPFEHPNLAAAQAERDRLSALHPGETFIVFAAIRPAIAGLT